MLFPPLYWAMILLYPCQQVMASQLYMQLFHIYLTYLEVSLMSVWLLKKLFYNKVS